MAGNREATVSRDGNPVQGKIVARNQLIRIAKEDGKGPGRLQSRGTGPFFGSTTPYSRQIDGRKHGPVPFAFDFAIVLRKGLDGVPGVW